ncbi:MAG: hypothetical protein Q7T18_07970, partial [Sedimentisphaerales bacterium]|nr:hypothetical protein [Sedimentisphaerales bacterium]
PPSLAFVSVAMGAFRGLLVDVLWMRMDKLKEQGQFFDAKQTAEWITTLQPRFAEVWDFQAWNMAYNISVAMPATQPAERWRWVKNGYELLRDQAIVKNPRNIGLYRSLGWIFLHKMGGSTDDVHKYYKLQLALAMRPLIRPAADVPLTNEFFKELADAPKEWQQIIEDSQVAAFVDALKKADPNFVGKDDDFITSYLSLRQMPGRFSPAAFAVIDRFRDSSALKKFDVFAKAFELQKTWKLDPALMQDLNRRYGPIDYNDPEQRSPLNWEHPDVHAMYWAALGLKMGSKAQYSIEEINTDRIVLHSLADLLTRGKMVLYDIPVDPNGASQGKGYVEQPLKTVFLFPDLQMFESYDQVIRATIEKYRKLGDDPKSMQDGHRNTLKTTIVSFYLAGHEVYAQRVYNELRQLYPRQEFNVPLVAFVKDQIHEDLKSVTINEAVRIIIGMLRESYRGYALHEDDQAYINEKWAKEIYDNYQAEWQDEKTLRMNLPQEFGMMRFIALNSFLNDEMFPPNLRLSLLGRMKLERPQLYQQLEDTANNLMEEANRAEPNQPGAPK